MDVFKGKLELEEEKLQQVASESQNVGDNEEVKEKELTKQLTIVKYLRVSRV